MERMRSLKYGSGLPQLALIQAHEARVAIPPASPLSTTVTSAPAFVRCQAIEAPMMPDPITMMRLLTWVSAGQMQPANC